MTKNRVSSKALKKVSQPHRLIRRKISVCTTSHASRPIRAKSAIADVFPAVTWFQLTDSRKYVCVRRLIKARQNQMTIPSYSVFRLQQSEVHISCLNVLDHNYDDNKRVRKSTNFKFVYFRLFPPVRLREKKNKKEKHSSTQSG